MWEKAALAAQQQRLKDFRSLGLPDPPDEENGPMPMDYRQVDAVLDAMREPHHEMLEATINTCHPGVMGVDTSPVNTWVSMIDAIKAGK